MPPRFDLVVLAYGTNEAGDVDVPMEAYDRDLRSVLARVRETVPNASCLLVGPSDRPERREDAISHRPRTDAIVESQRRIAAEMGCGFFDVVSFMGGPLSMVRWVGHQPPLGTPDHVHFTREGYERMGRMLLDALLDGVAPVLPEGPDNAHAQAARPDVP
jgi:lysophospholipase L1-like esterase